VAADPAIQIVELRPEHWPAVERIFEEGIATGLATFETSAPGWERWDASHLADQRFVALDDGHVVGWVAAGPVSARQAYAGVVEDSVYVSEQARGLGLGRLLLERLIASTEAAAIWTIQSAIFPENVASVRLHERVGFTIVGRRERLARLNGEWRDVLLLERRSPAIL
jgi:phosphinothricin acetyltransferase